MNEAVIRQEVERLAKSFNTSVTELVPRIQQYKMATSMFGAVVSLLFIIFIFIGFCILVKNASEYDKSCMIVGGIFSEVIPLIVLIVNSYEYVCWKFAPEIKCIEYIVHLVKN